MSQPTKRDSFHAYDVALEIVRAYATLAVALAKSHGHDLALAAIQNTTTLVVDSNSAPARLDTARAMAVVRGEIAGRVDKDRAIKRLTDVLNDPAGRDFIPLRLESRLEIARLRASLGDTETAASEARTVLEAAKQQNLSLTEHHANALLAELR